MTRSAPTLPNAHGKWAIFAESSNPNALIAEALSSSAAKFFPNGVEGAYKITADLGRIVGTKGETSVRTIVGKDGKIWTAFPEK
jgi:hypothetical protein